MKNIVNLKRLFLIQRKIIIENGKFYKSFFTVIIVVNAFFLIYPLLNRTVILHKSSFLDDYLAGIYIFGFFIGSQAFAELNGKKSSTRWLLFPATKAEKYIAVISINIFLFFIVYSLCFLLMSWGSISLFRNYFVNRHPQLYSLVELSQIDINTLTDYLLLYFSIQSFYVFGSVSIKKNPFLKCTVMLFLSLFIISIIRSMLKYFIFTGFELSFVPYILKSATIHGALVCLKFGGNMEPLNIVFYIINYYSWVPFFLIATWYKLKEKQL